MTATRERASKLWYTADRRLSAVRERADARWSRAEAFVAPFRDPVREPVAYVPGDPDVRRRLVRSALVGFAGSGLVLLGASLSSSPFTEKLSIYGPGPYTPAWFFGATLPGSPIFSNIPLPGQGFYLSLAAFYGGLVLLMQSWIRLSRLAREHPGIPHKIFAIVMAAWVLPMLFVEPLLSKDAYSYVAQGEMMSLHISPYRYGPAVLGSGANSYAILTDKLWRNVTSPYGPAFLGLGGVIQVLVRHSELWGLVAWRAVAVFGVVLIGVFIPRLARSFGRDPSSAFVFAVMNPIVLIHLIGGEHNDALMLGLMVAGLALACEGHRVVGIVLVALATMVKAPALLGVVYIGWDWAGRGASLRQRLKPLVAAGAIALVAMEAVTAAVGIGWGWIAALGNPDTVRSYLDPMTAIGLGLGGLISVAGLGNHSHLLLTLARGTGAAGAALIGAVLLWRARGGASSLRAIGLTMLAVVVLGPVMQPWYLAWGVVLLGPVAEGRMRGALVWLTVVVTFLGLGNVQWFVLEIGRANPFIVAGTTIALLALVAGPIVPKFRRGIAARRENGSPALAREKIGV
ncbi:MAG: polyprenol phosphomannose-dependent alpha 1,6 mannosyltransferase MptB [Acidimicrobiales bacterium]